jgi:hypothetical protein
MSNVTRIKGFSGSNPDLQMDFLAEGLRYSHQENADAFP